MTDREIAIAHQLLYDDGFHTRVDASVLAALAAARREQHAEDVRLLCKWRGPGEAADWLEQHKP
jgi:hypothetical protein